MLKLMAQFDDDTVHTLRQIQDTDTYEYRATQLSTGEYRTHIYNDKTHAINRFTVRLYYGAGLKLRPPLHFS